MTADPAECAHKRDEVLAYVEHVLVGREIGDRGDIEEHVCLCSTCATTYADLLGTKVMEEVERALDLTMGLGPGSDSVRIREGLGAFGLDLDLAMSLSLHWLNVSQTGPAADECSAASALTCIGAVLELNGNFSEALYRYDEAATLARRVDSGYARVRALSGKGRVLAASGRKREAVVSLRAACKDGSDLKDGFGVVRDYVALGDVLRDSRGIPGRLEALRCYGRASRMASEIAYRSGDAVARTRLNLNERATASFFRDLIGDFVRDHVKKEVLLLDEFCHAFFAGLGNVLGSGMLVAPQPVSSRLGFSASARDIKTAAVLSTVVTTFEGIVAGRLAGSIEEADGAAPAGDIAADQGGAIRQDIARATRRVAGEYGLSGVESGRLAEYLVQRISRDPELLEDFEFVTTES